MPTVGSLFAGVGGFDLGMEQVGFKVRWQAEWDKHCQSVLRRHWPDCALYGDVTDVNGAEIAPVDVITFGSPCQDLSVAGKRAGLDGDRSSMFFQAIRIIKEMRDATDGVFPRIAVWENVPGALSTNKGADFGVVLDALADIGAVAIEWAVLDAQHFGVPQRRRRVFVVAIFDPAVTGCCPDPLLPVGEGRRRHSAKSKSAREEVAGTLGGGSGSRGWSPDTDRMTFVPETTGTVSAKWSKGTGGPSGDETQNLIPFVKSRRADEGAPAYTLDQTSAQSVAQPLVYDGYNQDLDDSGVHRTLPIGRDSSDFVAQPIVFESTGGSWGVNAGETSPPIKVGSNRNIASPPAVAQPIEPVMPTLEFGGGGDNSPRMIQEGVVAPSLTAANNPSRSPQSSEVTEQVGAVFASQYAVRRLTPLECERLMGWPDDHTRWTDDGREQADSHRYRQCGNGVATPVAAWIGSHLLPLLKANDEQ